MAETVGDVVVRVGADTSGLTRGLQDADGKLKSFAGAAGRTVGNLAALGAAAAAAGTAIGVALAAKGLQAVDALDQMAERAGTSVRSIQSLQLSLGEAGISSEQMQNAIKKLTLSMGEAQAGNKTAQQAFDKLGLSVQALSDMDADQRFATIADAVSSYGNAADRSAAASDIFGAKLGPDLATAMAQGGDAIRQATSDIDAMGLALSDVDAAKVANAMDAFGRAQAVVDGIANKLAVELAPMIEAVSKAFLNAGKEGGGFGGAVSAAVAGATKVVGFLANAIDGIKRVIGVVANSLVYGFALIRDTFNKLALGIIKTLDMIPGVDLTANITALEAKIAESQGVMAQAAAQMRAEFEKPLAGDVFLKFAEDAKRASKEAAEATIAARQAAQGGDAAPVGVNSDEAEKARKQAEKLAAIDAESQKKKKEQAALAREELVADQAAKLKDLEAGLMSEREIMQADLEAKRQQILVANELGVGDKEANALLLEKIEADHAAAMMDLNNRDSKERADLESAASKEKIDGLRSTFGGISTLMNSESRKQFELGKAAAIANSTISAYDAITGSYAAGARIGGPILGAAFGAAAAVAQFAQINNIRKQQFRGGGGGSSASAGGSVTGAINNANTPVSPTGNSPSQRTNITLIGQNFGREQVISMLNEALGDGYTLGTA